MKLNTLKQGNGLIYILLLLISISVIKICDRLIQLLRQNSKDRILVESLWTTALVKYVRCFASGKRFGLSEKIFEGLKGDPIGTHNYYKEMRNKHIAHSVNAFEQVKTGLILSDPGIERKIKGIVTFSQWYISPKEDGIETLKNLCFVLRKKLSETGKKIHQEVLDAAAKLSINDLYLHAELRTITPGPEDASVPRNNT